MQMNRSIACEYTSFKDKKRFLKALSVEWLALYWPRSVVTWYTNLLATLYTKLPTGEPAEFNKLLTNCSSFCSGFLV